MTAVPLSVVMPAYDEEGSIAAAVAEVAACVLDGVPGAELVVVDDGSRDRTGAVLDDLAAREPRLRVVHKVNGGHGSAILAGVAASRGDVVFLVDADRQIPLDRFPAAFDVLRAGADVVLGVRRRRFDPRHRLLLSWAVRWTLRFLFGVRIHDANVPYKLFRRALWDEARALIPDDSLMPTLCFAVHAAATGRRVTEIDVVHRARSSGTGSLRPVKLALVCLRSFRQVWTFRWRLNRSLRTSVRPGS